MPRDYQFMPAVHVPVQAAIACCSTAPLCALASEDVEAGAPTHSETQSLTCLVYFAAIKAPGRYRDEMKKS